MEREMGETEMLKLGWQTVRNGAAGAAAGTASF